MKIRRTNPIGCEALYSISEDAPATSGCIQRARPHNHTVNVCDVNSVEIMLVRNARMKGQRLRANRLNRLISVAAFISSKNHVKHTRDVNANDNSFRCAPFLRF